VLRRQVEDPITARMVAEGGVSNIMLSEEAGDVVVVAV